MAAELWLLRLACKQPLAVGRFHGTDAAGVGSIFRARTFDGDDIACLERILVPALADQRIRRAAFTLPRRKGSVWLFRVEVDPDVRVCPFELCDCPSQ